MAPPARSRSICGRERKTARPSPRVSVSSGSSARREERVGDLERAEREHGAQEPLRHPLEQERQPDHRLGGADQPHDLHLVAPRVEHERGGGGDGEDGRQREHRAHAEPGELEQPLPLGEALHPLRPALHLLHLAQRGEPLHERARALRGGRSLVGVTSREAGSGFRGSWSTTLGLRRPASA